MKIPIEMTKSAYMIATVEIFILHLPCSIGNAQGLLNFNLIERTELEKLALLPIDLNFSLEIDLHYWPLFSLSLSFATVGVVLSLSFNCQILDCRSPILLVLRVYIS
jgi:hypothetical protein